jgi:hypothetical protein
MAIGVGFDDRKDAGIRTDTLSHESQIPRERPEVDFNPSAKMVCGWKSGHMKVKWR